MGFIANAQESFTPYSAKVDDASNLIEAQIDPIWMDKNEITWKQYKQFSAEVMSNLREQYLPGEKTLGIGSDAVSLPSTSYVDMCFATGTDGYPAISMTHYAASKFTKWLSAKIGDFYRLPMEGGNMYAE